MTIVDPMEAPPLELSVIVSCYFEESSIDEFHERLSLTLERLGRTHEMIFVNDGSSDGTFAKLGKIFERDPHVTAVVDLMKNSGQSNAKTPGVMLASGRSLVLLDSDLQLDPEELPRLVERRDQDYDIVSGYRENRQDSLLRTIPSRLANSIMRRASKSTLRDFGCTFKIYDWRLIRAFEFDQFKPWRPVPVIAAAQRIAEVPVSHHPRRYGSSGWTFRKLFSYNMENLVNLSDKPFQLFGAGFMLLALLFALRLGAEYFFDISVLERVTTGLVLNVTVVGLLAVLGVVSIIGEFVVRNFGMLQQRPAFAIRTILRRDPVDR